MAIVSKNLAELLERAAKSSNAAGLTIYPPGFIERDPDRITYRQLLETARSNVPLVKKIANDKPDTILLLHLDNHLDNVVWLWSVICAGCIPAMSTPFTNDLEARQKHILHLQGLLKNPVIITREHLIPEFTGLHHLLDLQTIENLISEIGAASLMDFGDSQMKESNDLAALMLTSGSTGFAKAVSLRHGQILAAIEGKTRYHGTTNTDVFLNWIGMDHVANLTEIHLHAMALGAEQVHVAAADLLAEPFAYLRLVDRHKVSYSFAPNFFLASLKRALEVYGPSQPETRLDLSFLRILISGGEANSTELCNSLAQLMGQYGAPRNFIRPGFGMTETCAGCIYSTQCPDCDLSNQSDFASLGSCIPGLTIRVTRQDGSIACVNETGNLELHGPVIFTEYWNIAEATTSTFTSDGWFVTGDKAFINPEGTLNLAGRSKETIINNGVKHVPQEIENALEEAEISGIMASYLATFGHRPANADTEALCVVYVPTYQQDDVASRAMTRDAICKVTMRKCMARPYCIIPLDEDLLQKSSLGKLSRIKIRDAFEKGDYAKWQQVDKELLQSWRATQLEGPSTTIETLLTQIFAEVFDLPFAHIGVDTSFFELGLTSIEVFKLKSLIEKRLNMSKKMPVITIMTRPTARKLAMVLETSEPHIYDPVVVLQSEGGKTPLWLIHPGVGEVLIFLNLAKRITDRPVYALRARGFDGEAYFTSIPEIVSVYQDSIKKVQPQGPYAIAGYSYGGTLAFELAKLLQSHGEDVKFLAAFDQPPHIKHRMRQGDWTDVVLTLARFFDLVNPETERIVSTELRGLPQGQILDYILTQSSVSRLRDLGLDKGKLANWASLAFNMHKIAREYEPTGKVPMLDIFYATPVSAVARDREEWVANHLSRWSEFVDDVVFHEVDGTHYNMCGVEHVGAFQKKLRAALSARGL